MSDKADCEMEIETVRDILDDLNVNKGELTPGTGGSDGSGSGNASDQKNVQGGDKSPKPNGKRNSAKCRWKPTSAELLEESETRILSKLKLPYTGRLVDIGPVVGTKNCEIWTVSLNESSKATPLVLLHGFGAGIGFWSLNLDALAANRSVYAIDHLGFGRSSRPKFSTNPEKAESQFVLAIEEWRAKVGLEKFVLLGHSFGGFLAMSYALTHPERVAHLILADPWGFPEKPKEDKRNLPWWVKTVAFVMRPMNPFFLIRFAGPKGPELLQRARPDLISKFRELNSGDEGDVRFGEYVYHCNAQAPSGETGFHTIMQDYGWAKFPMIHRIPNLDPEIPVTGIYGSTSWVDSISTDVWEQQRNGNGFVNIYTLNAGHHVYSDAKEEFNQVVLEACAMADGGKS